MNSIIHIVTQQASAEWDCSEQIQRGNSLNNNSCFASKYLIMPAVILDKLKIETRYSRHEL